MPVGMISYDSGGEGSLSYLHSDQVHHVQKATDGAGSVIYDRVITPFGRVVSTSGSLVTQLRFPGQRSDAETGLSQNWFRDYDPRLGRYVQSDPIGLAGGLNTYAYVGNNPLTAVDPDGLKTHIIAADIDLVIGLGGGVTLGVYLNTGVEEGENFDIGVTVSGRAAAGLDGSVGGHYGQFLGDASDLDGLSLFGELGVGFISYQTGVAIAPEDECDFLIPYHEYGLEASPLPASVEAGAELTGSLGYQDIKSFIESLFRN